MNKQDKDEILNLVSKDRLKDAIKLLMNSNSKEIVEEAIHHSGRLTNLYKQIRLGLISHEDQQLTNNQIRFAIIQILTALDEESQPEKYVLVAGTGRYDLPSNVYLIASYLGKALAMNNFKLVVGGWEGVDYVVSDEFSNSLRKLIRDKLSNHLIQVINENREPHFKGGNMIFVKEGLQEWFEAIKYSDVVVLIGGEGGTYETFMYANREGVPVIPVSNTGGDATRAYNEITSGWDYWKEYSLVGIEKHQLEKLNVPIHREKDAEITVNEIVKMIKLLPL